MHITEGFLPLIWATVWYIVAIPVVVYGGYKTKNYIQQNPRQKALLAVAAGFIFVLSSLKIPSVAGSTSHPTGTGIAVILFGPAVTAFFSTIVLLYQALLLAHGGITTLGANITSMGIVGPLLGWTIFRLVRQRTDLRKATFAATVIADWATYVLTSLQLAVAFPTNPGLGGIVESATNFLVIFGVTQIPIGIVEGTLAAALIGYISTSTNVVQEQLGVGT